MSFRESVVIPSMWHVRLCRYWTRAGSVLARSTTRNRCQFTLMDIACSAFVMPLVFGATAWLFAASCALSLYLWPDIGAPGQPWSIARSFFWDIQLRCPLWIVAILLEFWFGMQPSRYIQHAAWMLMLSVGAMEVEFGHLSLTFSERLILLQTIPFIGFGLMVLSWKAGRVIRSRVMPKTADPPKRSRQRTIASCAFLFGLLVVSVKGWSLVLIRGIRPAGISPESKGTQLFFHQNKGVRPLCFVLRAQVGLSDGHTDAGWIPNRVCARSIPPIPRPQKKNSEIGRKPTDAADQRTGSE